MKRSRSKPRKRLVGRSRPYRWKVTDRMWARLDGQLDDPPRHPRYPGRPRYSPRACLEGILYVLFTGTPWLELPYRELGLPSGETCRRRLEEWTRRGLLPRIIGVLHEELAVAERLDWSRVLVDASLVPAKKGAPRSRARSRPALAAAFI
jgi:transposase